MPITIDCFKAYDVRGRIPDQLNPDVAYRDLVDRETDFDPIRSDEDFQLLTSIVV